MKGLFIGILLALPFYGSSQEQVVIDSSYINGHYLQRLEFFKKVPKQKNEIVFLGNSITEGGKWQELIPNKHVVNRGISGDVTFGTIARMDVILASKPDKIFILIGINDMKRGIPQEIILNNYRKVIHMIKTQSPATKIYVESILPVNKAMLPASYAKLSNPAIIEINNQIKVICEKEKLNYVNLYEVFARPDGELKKELSIDGLHLKPVAYIQWADYLRKIKAL
ncbi:MAG: GDSL-type esterase/lipase family protein [Candidatus Pedobacter colombiensis]|uniref:GDSL-type esterase/lipase family protein n=1 Tax=Candidatus Pedobacter colombiensis TaxID=3121371 RepID=A0AAJ5W7P5_9SPHI|nr:GDSL-type esterase/lipase family protein [Pedobacter sp.]WEK18057.1 MAG: GDSL-type esterase/lipase family protein [Pedobacter sp.]